MSRLTILLDDKTYVTKDINGKFGEGYSGEAIDKLAKFENLYDHLMIQHEELPKELEVLRNEGKFKSYHFRERFGQKLTVKAFLRLLKEYGIE
jgi:hypothetical protein